MITILSPAKTLDFETRFDHLPVTVPEDIEMSEKLIKKLRTVSGKKLASLMNLSKDLATLNVDRYQNWSTEFNKENSRPALMTFAGDVFRGMDNKSFTEEDLVFANQHVRLLSGLHGLLRPLDQIQPYRLEMGTSLPVGRKKNIYQFWGDRVTNRINEAMEAAGTDTLLNLASTEYSKVVDLKKINGRVITPVFKDLKNGEYKVVMTWAKLARGMMTGFMVRNRLTNVEDIIGFNEYQYSEPLSTDSEWVFTRG
ncbi:MAG: peroxide stress protein YaaA [Flavobacteriales bacterium]|jgi:uncharacterized protein|nr:peroxide stress protein YaaA [Flavobacteriales bacterium]